MPSGIPLERITQTIAQCLQRLREKSILFCYRPHPDHAGRIELGSLGCHLKFVIQLWQQELSPTTTATNRIDELAPTASVVVELQRRRGCCVFMHHLRLPLFKALSELAAHGPEKSSEGNKSLGSRGSKTDAAEGLALGPDVLPIKPVSGRAEVAFPPPLRLPSF